MKNLHVLPTDKPSRLACDFDKLILNSRLLSPILYKTQNIYITNDEEIKEGVDQWYLDKFLNKPRSSGGSQYAEKQDVIILTTDQDLIKDGVQAIDDEFLEWFVQNPSYEEVDIMTDSYTMNQFFELKLKPDIFKYKIIIPSEEPKPHSFCETPNEKCTMNYCDTNGCQNRKRELVEPKQETLEEAIYKIFKSKEYSNLESNPNAYGFMLAGAQEGAKYQAERMYSEEEVTKLLISCKDRFGGSDLYDYTHDNEVKEWFEQFKKK